MKPVRLRMKINTAVRKPPKQEPRLDMILQKNKEMGGCLILETVRRRRNCRSIKCDREKLRREGEGPGLFLTSNVEG